MNIFNTKRYKQIIVPKKIKIVTQIVILFNVFWKNNNLKMVAILPIINTANNNFNILRYSEYNSLKLYNLHSLQYMYNTDIKKENIVEIISPLNPNIYDKIKFPIILIINITIVFFIGSVVFACAKNIFSKKFLIIIGIIETVYNTKDWVVISNDLNEKLPLKNNK